MSLPILFISFINANAFKNKYKLLHYLIFLFKFLNNHSITHDIIILITEHFIVITITILTLKIVALIMVRLEFFY